MRKVQIHANQNVNKIAKNQNIDSTAQEKEWEDRGKHCAQVEQRGNFLMALKQATKIPEQVNK